MSEHLTPEIPNDRGFQHMPPIETRHAATWAFVSVAESSAATGPHIWLTIEGRPLWEITTSSGDPDVVQGLPGHMSAHLTLDQARQLEEQLAWLRTHHYQNGGRDE